MGQGRGARRRGREKKQANTHGRGEEEKKREAPDAQGEKRLRAEHRSEPIRGGGTREEGDGDDSNDSSTQKREGKTEGRE